MLKKILKIIRFIIILAVVFIGMSYLIMGFMYKDTQKEATFGLVSINEHFYSDQSTADYNVIHMQDFIDNKLPANLQEAIYKDNWKFIVCKSIPECLSNQTGKLLTSTEENTYLGGLTCSNCRTVFIKTEANFNMTMESFVHELGHVASFEHASAHGSLQFHKIYNDFKDKYDCREYAKSLEAEFFADAFKDYYLDKEKLKKGAPMLYMYIDTVVHEDIPNDGFVNIALLRAKNTLNQMGQYIFILERKINSSFNK